MAETNLPEIPSVPDSADLPPPPEQGISPIRVEDEMNQSFLDYSMSVIVGRALPDARDGMKPVHRRCVFTMGEMGNTHSAAYKKSARVVGEVMGKYHPHGDASIYDTIVRLAQPFSMRYRLVEGNGNFGSMDGDKAAAMRYTEVRMQRFAEDMLEDLDKETVDMVPNYDGTLEEPTVLPSKLPNLLLNGSMGIAVGMATNIPTHNLNELFDAIVAMVDNPAITIDELMGYIKGPDFPTGGIICGTKPIRDMYVTGRGTLCVRGRAEIEEEGNHPRIIVTEIPYGVNKAEMLAHIGELIEDKTIQGIADIRDVSKADVRIEIDLKPDAVPQVVLNLLYKNTQLQTNFGANMLALDHGRPKVMNLKQFLRSFIDHRIEVITRRTKYLLRKAKERAHLLEGFRTAIDNIDEIVHIIRSSKDDDEAKSRMLDRFGLDDVQSSAILEMRLRQLTGLQRDRIEEEYQQKIQEIERYTFILGHPQEVLNMIKADCVEMKSKYGDARRTTIEAADGEIDLSKIIANENCVVTLSARGYIKRSSLAAFNEQRRGGKGRKGAKLKDADYVERVYNVMTHDSLLFFTSHGRVLTIERAWSIPDAEPNSFGRPVINLLPLRPAIQEGQKDADGNPLAPRAAERVLEIVSIGNHNEAVLSEESLAEEGRFAVNAKKPLFDNARAVLFATRKGIVKKTVLAEFKNINRNGIKAINIDDDDELVGVTLVERGDEVILVSANGQAMHFNERDLRPMGRVSRGVRGIRLDGVTFGAVEEDSEEGAEDAEDAVADIAPENADAVCAVVRVEKAPDARILLVVENGYGTLNTFDSYPIHRRGGKGVKSIQTDNRQGSTKVVFAAAVHLGEGGSPNVEESGSPNVEESGTQNVEGVETQGERSSADSILVVTAKGQMIRTRVDSIRETARNAKGVKVVSLDKGDSVVSATVVAGGADEAEAAPEESETKDGE